MKCCPILSNRGCKSVGFFFLLAGSFALLVFLTRYERMRMTENATTSSRLVETNSDSPVPSIPLDATSIAEVADSQPFLPEDRPDWVAMPDRIDGGVHRLASGTELADSEEECRTKLDDALLVSVRRYVDLHLAKGNRVASELPQLDASWIRKHLMGKEEPYLAKLERPSGTFYQLWVALEVGPDERRSIQGWIRQRDTVRRAALVGMAGGGLMVGLVFLHTGLRWLSKRSP